MTTDATAEVLSALLCLDRVARQTNGCSRKVMAAFAQQVERLQVGSIRVRARAQAIEARGDAYFEAWSKGLTPTNGPSIDLVAEHLPQMQKSFTRIKLASREAGQAFRPFLSGLRKLQLELEGNPGAIETVEGRELVLSTRGYGRQVAQNLGLITNELQILAGWYKPAKPVTNR